MKLMYDAGHGGKDPGALGGGREEDDLNLAIVLEMERITKLRHPDWVVILTRKDDVYVSPGARQRQCMAEKPSAFISVHCNADGNEAANGCECIYRDWVDRVVATEIQAKLITSLGLRNRGMKIDTEDLKRTLSVLSTPNIPSVIVEPGFITNDRDRAMLMQKELVARAIVDGVESWATRYKVL